MERNRGLHFTFRLFVPVVGACIGVSGGVGGLISRFFSTQRSFFPVLFPFFPPNAKQDGTESSQSFCNTPIFFLSSLHSFRQAGWYRITPCLGYGFGLVTASGTGYGLGLWAAAGAGLGVGWHLREQPRIASGGKCSIARRSLLGGFLLPRLALCLPLQRCHLDTQIGVGLPRLLQLALQLTAPRAHAARTIGVL